MQIRYRAFGVLIGAGALLCGCATNPSTTTQTQTNQTTKRVHTQAELKKSGQSDTGAALEKTDPTVRMSGPS
ncbi:MAG: hypothetical protein M3N48_15700 [Verrucomicrobiota bacterium]|nr:hypothetical protein [Verrucomicrobiota bacterium]